MHVFTDTETSGTSPRFDQVLQFASIACDDDLKEVEALEFRAKLLPYVLPAPAALVVTGVTPSQLALGREPMSAVKSMHWWLKRWNGATYCAYNGIKFDEEILRGEFWRNLLDPYVTSAKGSKRLDILKVAQAVHACDPTLFACGKTEAGNPSFKLDAFAAMNGYKGHQAHDALGDVRATIWLARQLRDKAPAVYQAMVDNADAAKVGAIAALPVFHLLTFFGAPHVHQLTVVATSPHNNKELACFDLAVDPAPYLSMDGAALHALFAEPAKCPLRLFAVNKNPAAFVPGGVGPKPAEIVSDAVLAERRARVTDPAFVKAVLDMLDLRKAGFAKPIHVEEKIYDGFAPWKDKDRAQSWHRVSDWAERYADAAKFQDGRLRQLAERLVWLNARQAMPDDLRASVGRGLYARLLEEGERPWTTFASARAQLVELRAKPDANQATLDTIEAWLQRRESQIRQALAQGEIPAAIPAAEAAATVEAATVDAPYA